MSTGQATGEPLELDGIPDGVMRVLATLAEAGHEAALVGGCLRDVLRGVTPGDWDVATSAPPEAVAALFPGATWENPFGTVTVRDDRGSAGGHGRGPLLVEVTTYRVESGYRDRRRPDEVRWGGSLADDLARRDFTINAIAWVPVDVARRSGRIVDPYGGRDDLRNRLLRAVGDPDRRMEEDALRLLRGIRFAVRFSMEIEPSTEAAIRRHAHAAAGLSGERVRDELLRIVAATDSAAPASAAFGMMEGVGLLAVILPELQALRGVPQAKALPGDALDHSLLTLDAVPPGDLVLRLVGLLHDVGKATTQADGHFYGHETVGAQMVEAIMRRLRFPRAQVARAGHLVRHHMFAYTPEWSDGAVRRFIRRVGPDALGDLFALRRADDRASGIEGQVPDALDELRARVGLELASHALSPGQLAVHGDDLVEALQLAPGPIVGRLLARLLEAVLDDPARNERATLLALAREWLAEETGPDAPERDSAR